MYTKIDTCDFCCCFVGSLCQGDYGTHAALQSSHDGLLQAQSGSEY